MTAACFVTQYCVSTGIIIMDENTDLVLKPLNFSVLYFSIHRYDHGRFWPEKEYSNFDFVGKREGEGFNINVAWNKV